MYLKSLQLVGFKSFAEKTNLEFLPGVTAIVGPNGCGKSNVADAIRWVLGEQSAKALRGSEMADVIFNGTDGRKPIGMAEVNMTFAEVDPNVLSLPGVNLDYSEVTITRRVYRDGTGEYLINKTPCRLRDVQNMFLDTGIGRSSYSLMAQGQIDQILSARPEDRRNIFEEAAGINKYKHQKKEALRKLEYTEANLVRLTDIIKEVKRQIISLQRQAGKARRYKEIFDQLKALDTRLARHKFDLVQADIAELEARSAEIAALSDQFGSEIADRELQVSQLRQSLAQLDQAINEAITRDHELRGESDRHNQRIVTNNERIAEFEQLIANHHREIAGAEEKIKVQQDQLALLNEQHGQIQEQLAAEQTKLQAQQDDFNRVAAEFASKTRVTQESQTALIEVERKIAGTRNELAALDHKKKHDVIRSERLSTEQLQLDDQKRALESRMANFNSELAALRTRVANQKKELELSATALKTASANLAAATHAHHAAVTTLSEKRTRLELLRQVFGAPDGHSTIGQVIEVDQHFASAVEAALQHNLRAVLADNFDHARSLLSGLQKNPAVAVPDIARVHTESPSCDVPLGGMAWASAVTRVCDVRYEPLIRSLLHNVVITGDLEVALSMRPYHPHLAMATVRGEYLDQHGILSAVSHSHIAEIGALQEEVNRLGANMAELADHKHTLDQRRAELEQTLANNRAEAHAQEVALASREGELRTLSSEQRDLDNKLNTVVHELNALHQQDAEETKRRAGLTEQLRASESRITTLREELEIARQELSALSLRKEESTQKLTELRVSVGGWDHKRRSIEGQREPIAGRIRDFTERIQTCQNEIEHHSQRIQQLRAEITESEQRILELQAQREQQLQQQISGFQVQRHEVATGIDQAEEELRALRKQSAESLDQKSGCDVALAQKRMELQNLRDRVFQRYQVNIEDVHGDSYTITVADQGAPVSQTVSIGSDWEAVEAQVAEWQAKLDSMGPVNVEAIQEFDELEERYKFLSQQHEDLVKAKEQLLHVIAKINSTTKQLFQETFDKVRENFHVMFTELFGGGKANLHLVDETDPLDSGIEIIAKPPGKQFQSISLLSGGERTLTATALLFAIYMVKPSPFCVLDELDAPLDESNINRFIRILQRFVTQSQFVVITHNKRTIGMADALYGVTMEEHGVSKVVSVRFSPREEQSRRQIEKQREQQEDRIDGAATLKEDGSTLRAELSHEDDLHNDLLKVKEQSVAPIQNLAPIEAPEPIVSSAPPPPDASEVQEAIAHIKALNDDIKEVLNATTTEPAS